MQNPFRHIFIAAAFVMGIVSCDTLHQLPISINIPEAENLTPNSSEIASGLKEALVNGIGKGTGKLNQKVPSSKMPR